MNVIIVNDVMFGNATMHTHTLKNNKSILGYSVSLDPDTGEMINGTVVLYEINLSDFLKSYFLDNYCKLFI